MKFSDEVSFLLDCTCVHPDSIRIERMRRRIEAGVNWGEVLRIAIPHGVLPLLGKNLSSYASDIVPAITIAQLELQRRRVEHRNRKQVAELLRVMSEFSRLNIRAFPFKGTSLAAAAYGDLSLRESHDLDFWIDPGSLPAASDLLRGAGYRGVGHKQGVPQVLITDGGDEQTEFISADGDVLIELHTELQSRQFSFSPDFDDAWDRRAEIKFDGVTLPALQAGDLLLALAVHGSKHLWNRLIWVVDFVALIEANPGINWDDLLQNARKWKGSRRLLSATMLSDELYGLNLPASYREECMRHSYTRSTVRRMASQIIAGVEARSISNFVSELRNHCENSDTVATRARIASSYLKKLLHAQESRMIRSMPKGTWFVFRITRGVRMLLGRVVPQD